MSVVTLENSESEVKRVIPDTWGVEAFEDEYGYPYRQFSIDVTGVFKDADWQDKELLLELKSADGEDLST